MPLAILHSETSLEVFDEELQYTRSRITAHPLSAHLASGFETLGGELDALMQKQRSLRHARIFAQVLVDVADSKLGRSANEVSARILLEVGRDREAPLYRQFFGTKTLTVFIRPVLGEKLEAMSQWPTWLASRPEQAFKDLAPRVDSATSAAIEAEKARADADAANASFRLTGDRQIWLDKFNALRATTYGELARIGLENHESKNFADDFFRHDNRPTKKSSEKTEESLLKLIAASQAQTAKLQDELAALKLAAQEAEAARKRQADHRAEVAAAEKAAVDATAKVAELKKKKVD